jgi:putative polyhydroxyalkanoate system protein
MGKAIILTLPHDLGRAEARRRIDEGFTAFARHVGATAGGLTKSWSGDRLNFALRMLGQTVSGDVDVEDAAIRLEVRLPMLLARMAEMLKGRLRNEGLRLLEKK